MGVKIDMCVECLNEGRVCSKCRAKAIVGATCKRCRPRLIATLEAIGKKSAVGQTTMM